MEDDDGEDMFSGEARGHMRPPTAPLISACKKCKVSCSALKLPVQRGGMGLGRGAGTGFKHLAEGRISKFPSCQEIGSRTSLATPKVEDFENAHLTMLGVFLWSAVPTHCCLRLRLNREANWD